MCELIKADELRSHLSSLIGPLMLLQKDILYQDVLVSQSSEEREEKRRGGTSTTIDDLLEDIYVQQVNLSLAVLSALERKFEAIRVEADNMLRAFKNRLVLQRIGKIDGVMQAMIDERLSSFRQS